MSMLYYIYLLSPSLSLSYILVDPIINDYISYLAIINYLEDYIKIKKITIRIDSLSPYLQLIFYHFSLLYPPIM